MKSYKYIIAILLNLIVLSMQAQTWVTIDSEAVNKQHPQINVIVSNAEQYKFCMRIYGYEKSTIYENNIPYEQISIADWQPSFNNVGEPSLPAFTQFIGLPANKECNVTISNAEWATLPVGKIYPSQEFREESDTTEIQFTINDSIYNSNEYVTERYIIGEKACVGGMYGVTLSVVPIKYYPSRNEMDILKSCVVTVNFTQSSAVNENLSIKNKKLVKYVVDNYNEALLDSYNTYIDNSTDGESAANIYDYLIITADKYKDTDELKTFCAWKKIKGHNCKVVSCGEIGSTHLDSIKSCIKEWYEKGVEYVLLVGNCDEIPCKRWYYPLGELKNKYSDYWYVCINSEHFADIAVGRFCINDTIELCNIISKTINYENLTPEDTWVTKNLLVAHQQDAPAKYQACCEEIRTATYDNMPNFTTAYGAPDSVGGDNATNDTIVSLINDGFGIVNYRGHGKEHCWKGDWGQSDKPFDHTFLGMLRNLKYPIVFSIACRTGNIAVSQLANCLLRNFIKMKHGAVAFLGSTRPIETTSSDLLNKFLYKSLYNDEVYEFAYLSNLAHTKNILSSPYDKDSLKESVSSAISFINGGDPSLEIWTDTISKFPQIDFTYENGAVNIDTRTIEDYTITIFSLTDSCYFRKISVEGTTATITNVPSSFVMSINKHNYMPLVYNISDGDIFMQNENYALVREIVGNNVYIGSDVTDAQPRGKVTIKSKAGMNIDAKGKTIVNKGVVIEKGAKVYIK